MQSKLNKNHSNIIKKWNKFYNKTKLCSRKENSNILRNKNKQTKKKDNYNYSKKNNYNKKSDKNSKGNSKEGECEKTMRRKWNKQKYKWLKNWTVKSKICIEFKNREIKSKSTNKMMI